MNRRRFLKITAGLALANVLPACQDRQIDPQYKRSPLKEMLAWIKKQHIEGNSEENTFYRLIRWMRLNCNHYSSLDQCKGRCLTKEFYAQRIPILERLTDWNPQTGIELNGCAGVASAIQRVLEILDIEIVRKRVTIMGIENHSAFYMPLIDHGTIHADDIFAYRAIRSGGKIDFEVPSQELMVSGNTYKADDLIYAYAEKDVRVCLQCAPVTKVYNYALARLQNQQPEIYETYENGQVTAPYAKDIEQVRKKYAWLEQEIEAYGGFEQAVHTIGPNILNPPFFKKVVPADFEIK